MSKPTLPRLGPYRLKRSSRRTLAISVLPDGQIEVVAPAGIKRPAIEAKLNKRVGWIMRQRQMFASLNAGRSKRRYCSGASHRYLGRQYLLRVTVGKKVGARLAGKYLEVCVPRRSAQAVAAQVARWMRDKARIQFDRRLQARRAWCDRLGLPEPTLFLLAMPKRWGSAHPSGRISLNPELIRAPSACVDYVIAHELCHLKHPNHGRGFLAELQRLCPDWKTRKKRLETFDQ